MESILFSEDKWCNECAKAVGLDHMVALGFNRGVKGINSKMRSVGSTHLGHYIICVDPMDLILG